MSRRSVGTGTAVAIGLGVLVLLLLSVALWIVPPILVVALAFPALGITGGVALLYGIATFAAWWLILGVLNALK